MNPNVQQLIGGYLDETLSPAAHAALGLWLKESPENARQFAQAVLVHDRLRSEVLARAAMTQAMCPVSLKSPSLNLRRRYRPLVVMVSAACAVVVAITFLWKGVGESPASAAVTELNRIIAVSAQRVDRTYQIKVENEAIEQRGGKRRPPPPPPNRGRPPKPPMNGAVLHVRGERQFVLVRMTLSGRPFVTGSNGQTSWAVRPDGPVRVSSNLTRFSHDLPGHEHSIPLINIQEGLEGLLGAYDVELQPVASQQDETRSADDASRSIVAAKKSASHRGPRRVEITYAVRNGLIQQMRFVDLPYAPGRSLTLLLTLVEEQSLGANFFDHESHHEPGRAVEFEE